MRDFHLDFETRSELDLPKVGLPRYVDHESTQILMCSYAYDDEETELWDATDESIPAKLEDALADDRVTKWAFNAAFERKFVWEKLGIKGSYGAWRCSMVLAYMQSFMGGLGDIGAQMGIPSQYQKDIEGERLMRVFSRPQRVTKKNPFRWRDKFTDPEDWHKYGLYCRQDTRSERYIKQKLIKFPIQEQEWKLYALDQLINDRGIPLDLDFVNNGIEMAALRKSEIISEMRELTGLANPNSVQQLLGFVKQEGYWFNDLGKNTVKKVLAENEYRQEMTPQGEAALRLRQASARSSTAKYTAFRDRVSEDGRLRHALQFAGASRTNRWAGRGAQIHNLSSTPGIFEDNHELLVENVEAISTGDYGLLKLLAVEPLDMLAGLVRSSIKAPEGEHFVVCDLSSIESVVLGGLSGCERILNVFRDGKDAYKDFATELYKVPYEEVTKDQRKKAKPATLGAGYRLGGGEERAGKKTGLWGYAESMGIDLTQDEAQHSVDVFRETYHEVPKFWYALENAIARTIVRGVETQVGLLRFTMNKPYLCAHLPSGRIMYYYKPQVHVETRHSYRTGNDYEKEVISYMGKNQITQQWERLSSHGGLLTENFVQAVARDILAVGMKRAHKAGFNLVMHVHDELVALQKIGDNRFTWEFLRELMKAPISWFPGLPLGAAGFHSVIYKKD